MLASYWIGRLRRGILQKTRLWFSTARETIVTANDLLQKTRAFQAKIPNTGLLRGNLQAENHALWKAWRHILFRIPHDEAKLLRMSAQSIDELLRMNLNQFAGKNSTVPLPAFFEDIETSIYAWGRAATEDSGAPLKAESLVQKYQTIQRHKEISMTFPTKGVCSALVYCWSKAPNHKLASEKSLWWFQKISEDRTMTVDAEAWNALLRIHVRQGKFSGITRNLFQKYDSLNNGYTYAILVQGWMKSDPSAEGSKRAFDELQRGIAYCLEHRGEQIPALRQLIFQYLVGSIVRGSLLDCERAMNQAIGLQEKDIALKILDLKHFIVVMKAFAERRDPEKVQDLFRKLQSIYDGGSEWLKPNYRVLVVVLTALAKAKDRRSLETCESLISMVESCVLAPEAASPEQELTNHAHNVMLECYIQNPHVKNKTDRVERLMQRMETLSSRYHNPLLLPDRLSYGTLMKAIVYEKKPGCFSKIDSLLSTMESSDQPLMQPDRKTYTIALEALFLESGNQSLSRAYNLLERMNRTINALPDRIMYTMLMKIHSSVGDAHGCERVLNELMEAFENGRTDCRPNEKVFLTAMSAWERSGKGDLMDHAFSLYNQMTILCQKGIRDCRPSRKVFGMLMVIVAKSENDRKLQLAQRLLSEMKTHGVEPDATILNWYIRVCTTVPGEGEHNESWHEALTTYQILRQRGIANAHSYNSMLHAGQRLLRDAPERQKFFRDTFYECRNDGQVDRRILTSLKRFLPPKQYQHLTKMNPRESIQMKVYRELNEVPKRE